MPAVLAMRTSDLSPIATTAQALLTELRRVIVGQDDILRGVVIALLAGGHVLLEGNPGLAKTLMIRTLSQLLTLDFRRIQCTPDLKTPAIVGPSPDRPGPLVTHLLLADELNRAIPDTQSAFLEAMAERSITVDGMTRPLPMPFMVCATQNPLETVGTYPLSEAMLDRFLLKLLVPSPTPSELMAILERTTQGTGVTLTPLTDATTLSSYQAQLASCPVPLAIRALAVTWVTASHPSHPTAPATVRRLIHIGASPRGGQSLLWAAKVQALLSGHETVSVDDLRAVAIPCLRHRLIRNFAGLASVTNPDQVVQAIMTMHPHPSDEALSVVLMESARC